VEEELVAALCAEMDDDELENIPVMKLPTIFDEGGEDSSSEMSEEACLVVSSSPKNTSEQGLSAGDPALFRKIARLLGLPLDERIESQLTALESRFEVIHALNLRIVFTGFPGRKKTKTTMIRMEHLITVVA